MAYCPEINPETWAEKEEHVLDWMKTCHTFTDDISTLDDFTGPIYLHMKSSGKGGSRSMGIIIYSRRYASFDILNG
jgi:hypothetical protein